MSLLQGRVGLSHMKMQNPGRSGQVWGPRVWTLGEASPQSQGLPEPQLALSPPVHSSQPFSRSRSSYSEDLGSGFLQGFHPPQMS
jgi:hypothetical protein